MSIPRIGYSDCSAEKLSELDAAILQGFPTGTNRPLISLAAGLGKISVDGINSASNDLEDGCIHLVYDHKAPVVDPFGNAMVSTTHAAFPLHTDEYFAATPAKYVFLLCIRPSGEGGESLITIVDHAVANLSPAARRELGRPIFPSQAGPVRLLWHSGIGWAVRFNELEMRRAILPTTAPLSLAAIEAIGEFKDCATAKQIQFPLIAGECLFLRNERVLHGRRPFSPRSARLLKRIRVK